MIHIQCMACNASLSANDSDVGRSLRCPGCGRTLVVPQWSSASPNNPIAFPPPMLAQTQPNDQEMNPAPIDTRLVVATRNVFVTPAIIGLNLIYFIVMLIGGVHWMNPTSESLVGWGANFWPLTTHGQWWRLLTSGFIHIGLIHLLFNMQALLVFGPITERLFGHVRFGLIYFYSLIIGSIASIFFNHQVTSAGASGAIFGVGGAMLAFSLTSSQRMASQHLAKIRASAGVFIMYNLFGGFTMAGIDNAAHIGGLVGGFIAGMTLTHQLEGQRVGRGRSIVAQLAAISLLVGAFVALPRVQWDFLAGDVMRQKLDAFGDVEQSAVKAHSALRIARKQEKITDAEYADGIETKVLPLWTGENKSISELKPSGIAVLDNARELYVRYTALRIESYKAEMDAARNNSEASLERYNALTEQANDVVEQINSSHKELELWIRKNM